MIYDTFIFHDELDILNARLHELDSVVDRFVVVESTKTFSNRRKSLFFEENRLFYSAFLDKIIHVIVDDMPNSDNAWDRETHQRNAIMRGLVDANENDMIMISDVDEIPFSGIVDFIKPNTALRQQFFYYTPYDELNYHWHGTCCAFMKDVDTPQRLRDQRYSLPAHPFPDWHGVHLSYWMPKGDLTRVRRKIESMSDVYLNTDEFKSDENLYNALEKHKDLFGRNIEIIHHVQSPIPERILKWL